jgi:hypothetical protein
MGGTTAGHSASGTSLLGRRIPEAERPGVHPGVSGSAGGRGPAIAALRRVGVVGGRRQRDQQRANRGREKGLEHRTPPRTLCGAVLLSRAVYPSALPPCASIREPAG